MKIDTVVGRIQTAATKIQENTYVKSIMGGFMASMPVLLFGAICALIVGFPVDAWTEWVSGNALGTVLSFGSAATTNMLALYVVAAISYTLARESRQDPLAVVITALMSFLLVLPFQVVMTLEDGTELPVNDVLPVTWLGPQGVFTAIIVALVAGRLYAAIANRGWKIKMPASVPPMVSRPFEAIIPVAIIGTLFLVVRMIFEATPYEHFGGFVFSIIGEPLSGLGNSYWAWVVLILAAQLCWFVGIHNIAVWSVVLPVVIGPMYAQQEAGVAGEPLPYIITFTLVFAIYQWVGGPGNLLGLSTNMVLFAKSKRYKTLGRLAFPPSVFNIIEPLMFGFPVVFNPLMGIPFILLPVINFTAGYLLLSAGIIGNPYVALPFNVFTMPFIPGGFLLGAGIGFGVFLILTFVLSVVVYFPFFKMADRKALLEERGSDNVPDGVEVTGAVGADAKAEA